MKKIISTAFVILMVTLISCGQGEDEKYIYATGTIETKEATISAKIAGEIKHIRFDEGEKVNKGDTVIQIDNEIWLIQIKQAEANKIIADAQLELLKKGARKEDIAQAEEMYKQADKNYQQALNDKVRMERLFESQSISKKQLEDFILKYDLALAQLNSSKENLNKIKNLARPEELKQAEAKYKQALANEELIRKNLRDSYVISPIDGIIVKSYVEVGENVTMMSSLFKVSELSIVELTIYLSEVQLGKVKLGQKAEISVDAFPDKVFEGTVIFISPEAEFTPKNIQTKDERTKQVFGIKIKVPNPNFELKTGLPADAKILIAPLTPPKGEKKTPNRKHVNCS